MAIRPRQHLGAMSGFTLLELLLVLTILALSAAVVPPMFNAALPGVETRATLRQVVAGMQQARSLAITRNAPVALTLDRQAHRFELGERHHPLPSDVSIEVAGHEQPRVRLLFYPDGTSSGATIHIRRGGHRYRIELDWLTGAPRVSHAGQTVPEVRHA